MLFRIICLFLIIAASTSGPAYALGITVSPYKAMIDAPIAIRVQGRPGSIVTVSATTERFGLTFQSSARFRMPHSGKLTLSEQAPLAGSYAVKNGMGLFWSMTPNDSPPKKFEFRRDSDLDPRPYEISVTDGAHSAHVKGTRVVLADSVTRKVVDNGPLVATLFTPRNAACSPGVVVLGGSEGGVPEEQGAVLASHGFTTLALAYFGAPGLSDTLTNIPIESVRAGLQFLRSQSGVCNGPIGLLGGSKGAELALVAASRFSEAGALVAYSPASVVFAGIGGRSDTATSSWSFEGAPLPFANGTAPSSVRAAIAAQRKARQQVSYRADYLAQLQGNTNASAVIPVTSIHGPILLIAGGVDMLWPSDIMANQIMETLKANNNPYGAQLLIYPSAGHPIGLPYEFAKAELAHSDLALGGTGESNEQAAEASWPLVLRFLKTALH